MINHPWLGQLVRQLYKWNVPGAVALGADAEELEDCLPFMEGSHDVLTHREMGCADKTKCTVSI